MGALRKHKVDYDFVDPPKHIYRYARTSGEVAYYGGPKQRFHNVYITDAMPTCEAGSNLDIITDDGSRGFKQLYAAVRDGNTVRRLEKASGKLSHRGKR